MLADVTKQRFKAYVQAAQKERDRRNAAAVLKKLVQVRSPLARWARWLAGLGARVCSHSRPLTGHTDVNHRRCLSVSPALPPHSSTRSS